MMAATSLRRGLCMKRACQLPCTALLGGSQAFVATPAEELMLPLLEPVAYTMSVVPVPEAEYQYSAINDLVPLGVEMPAVIFVYTVSTPHPNVVLEVE